MEFRLPDIGEGLTEAEITKWLVAEGERVEQDQPLVEVETDKAVVELPSPVAGVVTRHGADEGAVLAVGEVLAVIDTGEPDAGSGPEPVESVVSEPPPPEVSSAQPASTPSRVLAMPLVRKLAKELGVDLAGIAGTGPNGRITREDVERAAGAAVHTEPAGDVRVRQSKLRRTIAENLTRSWKEIPHVTTFDEVEAAKLLEARVIVAERIGRPVALEVLLIAAVSPVLGAHPEFNATVDGDDVVLHRDRHIGFAVDTPEGLIVPVVRHAPDRSLADLAAEVERLADGARRRALSPEDLTGATFTISNVGAVGGGFGTPIIPYGTTAIVSFGRAVDRPVVRDGQVAAASVMPIALSYDHRVIDGALGQRFTDDLVSNLSNPLRFLL